MKIQSFFPSAVFFLLSLGTTNSFSQSSDIKRTYHWYFGDHAGLDFSGGTPVAVVNNMFGYVMGSACVSDTAGNFLFATVGATVWDKNQNLMPNGTGLLSDWGNSQRGIILPKPGSDSLYYVFTSDLSFGINYSVVDMSPNGGLGDVVVKNVPLGNGIAGGKVTAVRHCNGKDIWVITKPADFTNAFYVYLLTNAGVSAAPVISNIGLAHHPIGHMKASPDGKHIASASKLVGSDVLDFDNATGILSNPVTLSLGTAAWGVSFSPNSKILYIAYYNGGIDQYDLCAANIPASATPIAAGGSLIGAIQQASDGKIYTVTATFVNGQKYLGVINNPNTLGFSCNYVDAGVYLGGVDGGDGLPNFFEAYFDTTTGSGIVANFNATTVCLGNSTQFTDSSIVAGPCTPSGKPTNWLWNFGDPASGYADTSTLQNPGHIYSSAGTYTVTLIVQRACQADTTIQTITVNPSPSATASANTTICVGANVILSASGGTNYSWSNGNINSTINVFPTSTSTYSVIVFIGSCADTATATVTVNICDTVIIDTLDCSTTGELYIPNAFSPNNDGENDVLKIYCGNILCIKTLELVIYDRWGEVVFSATGDPASGGETFEWDGFYKGKLQNTSVFVYYLNATLISGEEISRKGNISILR